MITTGRQLAEKCLDVANNYKTVYALGCFGWPMTFENQNRALNSYAFNAGLERSQAIRAASKDTFGFDCICLLKGLLWGWNGDAGKPYGGAVYAANGVPDLDEGTMLECCRCIREDFSNVPVGAYLWTNGHCGIYVGGGKAVECTYRWCDGVQVTSVYNITGNNGNKGRYWKKHGMLPYLDYEQVSEKTDFSIEMKNLRKGDKGNSVKALQHLLIGRGFSCGGWGADGDFGSATEVAVIAFQRSADLGADGVVGKMTMGALLGVML